MFSCFLNLVQEKKNVLATLALKAKLVADGFNAVDGVSCNPVMGAMYSFPKINIPQKAIDKATVCRKLSIIQGVGGVAWGCF